MSDTSSDLALSFLRERGTNFPEFPKLVEDVLVFHMPDGLGIQFRGLPNPVVLRGGLVESLLPQMLPLLDGTRDVHQLVKELSGQARAADVASLLMNLFVRGAIADPDACDSSRNANASQRLFFSRRLGVSRNNRSAGQVCEGLARSRVVLLADGLLGLSAAELLLNSGFESIEAAVAEDSEMFGALQEAVNLERIKLNKDSVATYLKRKAGGADLVVVALRNASIALFESINRICVESSVQWLRAHDDCSSIEVGPYVNPHDSPCFECMIIRQIGVNEHAIEDELYQKFLEEQKNVSSLQGESVALANLAASYLVQEAVRIVSGIERPFLEGSVVSFYSDGNISQNSFYRVPRCEVCSRGRKFVAAEKTHASIRS